MDNDTHSTTRQPRDAAVTTTRTGSSDGHRPRRHSAADRGGPPAGDRPPTPGHRCAARASSQRAAAAAVDNVASVGDLRQAGLSAHAISTRCRPGGPWQQMFPKVVLLQPEPPSRRQVVRAVLAHLGPDAIITGVDALRAHGADLAAPAGAVHALIPAGRRVAGTATMRVERTTRPPRSVTVDGQAFAVPARACLDAARAEPNPARMSALLLAPVRAGLCEPAELRTELDEGSQRGAAGPRAALRELECKLAFLSEQRARRIVAGSPLPEPRWRVPVAGDDEQLLTVVPAYWPETRLGWDISPDGHHRAALAGAGVPAVHTPPALLVRDPAAVRAMLEAAYRSASGTLGLRESR